MALGEAGIIVNRNTVPFDPRPGLVTSGMRLGTPAVTTRGLGQAEMKTIAGWVVKVIKHIEDKAVPDQVREEVAELCQRFPVPGIDD